MEMDLHPRVSYGKDVEAEKTPVLSSGPQTDVMVDDVMGPWLSSKGYSRKALLVYFGVSSPLDFSSSLSPYCLIRPVYSGCLV